MIKHTQPPKRSNNNQNIIVGAQNFSLETATKISALERPTKIVEISK